MKYNDEKEPLTHSKQEVIFEELANRKMQEVRDLSKQIDFNNLIYHYKSENVPKIFLCFKGPLKCFKNIKESNITLKN